MKLRNDLLICLAAVLGTLLALTVAFHQVWPLTVQLGERDARFVQGFHEPERFGGDLARWSTANAALLLPRSSDGTPARLVLRLRESRPADQPPARVTISAESGPLASFTLERGTTGVRRYQLLLPGSLGFQWHTTIAISSDTISTPNDPRPLGVVVDQATLHPLPSIWPSLWIALWGVALAVVSYAMLRSLAAKPLLALGVTLGLAALLAGATATRPLELLPFLQRIPALLALLLAIFWLGRWLCNATTDTTISGAQLPILLGVAFWVGPLVQIILTLDGAQGVTPPPPTAWIAASLAVAVVCAITLRLVRPQAFDHARMVNVVLVFLALAATLQLTYSIWFAFQRQGPDFWILFKGAREWARGGSMYNLVDITTNHFGHVFKVPPFYGMLFLPWVFQDGERILWFHRMLNVVLLAVAIICWLRMWGIHLWSLVAAGTLVLISFRPFADTIAYGQIDLTLLLLLVLALWALRNERDLLAGMLVALGTLLKIYPILLLAFFVVKLRWRALAGFALAMLICNGLAIGIVGWEMHRTYLFEVLPRIGGTTAWIENQTISGFLARLVSSPTDSGIFPDRMLGLVGLGIGALLGGLACLLSLAPAAHRSTTFALQYGQFLLLMVLVVPAAWMHYETLLFVPYAALLLHFRERNLSLGTASALALSFALVAYGNQWSYFSGTVMGVLTTAGVSYKLYGMLLLCGVLVAELSPAFNVGQLRTWFATITRLGRRLPNQQPQTSSSDI
jgi:hypothetical protein